MKPSQFHQIGLSMIQKQSRLTTENYVLVLILKTAYKKQILQQTIKEGVKQLCFDSSPVLSKDVA